MNSYGFSLRRSKTTSSSVGKSTDSIIQLLPFSSQNQKHTPLYSTSHPEAHCLNKQWKTRHVLKDFLILQIPLVFLFLAAKIALLNDTSVKETSSPREFINTVWKSLICQNSNLDIYCIRQSLFGPIALLSS